MDEALLPLLPSLVALIEEEGVSKAARRVGVSQPRMSARLAELRRLLDDPLLTPASSRRGVMATTRGVKLAQAARTTLAALDRALSLESFDPGREARTFRIVADETAAITVAPALMRRVADAGGAAVTLAFFTFDRGRLEGLETGAYDLVLGRPHQLTCMPLLTTRVVARTSFAVISSATAGDAVRDLDEYCRRPHVLISSQPEVLAGRVDEELAKVGRKRFIAASVQSHLLASELVATGDLIATVPDTPALRMRSSLRVEPPPLEFESFLVCAAWHPKRSADPANVWLRDRLGSL